MAKRSASHTAAEIPTEPLPRPDAEHDPIVQPIESVAGSMAGERKPRRQVPWTPADEKGTTTKLTVRIWSRAYDRLRDHAHKTKVRPHVLLSRLIMRECPEYEMVKKQRGHSEGINDDGSEENQAA